ncbi:hypothetical protein DB347_10630 [Opitutaceae bacterium EW11]|nr:hypothetical protein DB347_10630 [Opitutaceae bacterium EW11]
MFSRLRSAILSMCRRLGLMPSGGSSPRNLAQPDVSPAACEKLRRLRGEQKFGAHDFYTGAPTEEVRRRCEARVNHYLDAMLEELCGERNPKQLLALARHLEESFHSEDTEEREEATVYLAESMRAVGIGDCRTTSES